METKDISKTFERDPIYNTSPILDETNSEEMTGSEAIYGFCAWLTTRKEKTVLSGKHNAVPIADLINEFCKVNKLGDPRDNWTDYLTHPKE